MKLSVLIGLLLTTLLLAGCGSKKSATPTTTTVPNVPAAAQTSDQWASRVVDWFLRPLSPDLLVVGNFANSQVRFYIETQNQEALQTIYARMNDLQRCDDHLTRVGPPPGKDQQLKQIDNHFHKACAAYARIGATLTHATRLLSSGKQEQVAQGEESLRGIGATTRSAALELTAGVKLAQGRGDFRRAGLKPSV
ncbi:MAG: hypothetical protein V7645_410 [Actinomycetota bacterium]|jgi:hypothetical protein